MTIAVREKGKTLEESGGLVMTTDSWLAPRIAGMKDVLEFDKRYAQKLAGSMMPSAAQMAAALAMYPGLQAAMKRMESEKVNMDGTAIQMTMTVDAVKNPEQAAEQPSGGGGLGGMLGRFKKKKEDAPANPNRATFMRSNYELLKVRTDVSSADVAMPAGYMPKS